jgi:hypothetical protein
MSISTQGIVQSSNRNTLVEYVQKLIINEQNKEEVLTWFDLVERYELPIHLRNAVARGYYLDGISNISAERVLSDFASGYLFFLHEVGRERAKLLVEFIRSLYRQGVEVL